MVTMSESAVISAILVSPCELNIPGVVVVTAYFGGILLAIFYRNLGSECVMKPCGKCHGGLLNGLGM